MIFHLDHVVSDKGFWIGFFCLFFDFLFPPNNFNKFTLYGFYAIGHFHEIDPVVLSFQRELLAEQRIQWQKILLQALRESKMILAKSNTRDYRLNLYPYLCLLEDKEYVDIMIQVIQAT